jgi:hypothetical protein
MATKTRARFAEESESYLEPANKNTRALRYDSFSSVLTNLDKQATVLPGKLSSIGSRAWILLSSRGCARMWRL